MIGREDEVRPYRERVKFVYAIAFALFGIIVARLVFLQLIKGEELRRFSDNNRLKKEKLFASRGIIFDRNGKVIVDNRASFDVVLLSQYYTFSEENNAKLAKALQMTREELDRRISKLGKKSSFYPVLLKADVSKDIIAAIETEGEGLKGVDIEVNVQRRYPQGDVAAQLLGYTGEVDKREIASDQKKRFEAGDYIGKAGVERQYDDQLRGLNGVGYMEVDAMGRRRQAEGGEKVLGFVAQTEPVSGNNIYLTLDLDLQQTAANAFKTRGFNGSLVAMDPRNGEILALVNYPSYEPQRISGREVNPKTWRELAEDKDRPLRNRAIQDHYPPGSTFKLLLAVAGLAEGLVTEKSSVVCNGSIAFGKRHFNCWKRHGPCDFVRAIKESCDVFFYNLGLQLGVDRIAKYARLFGLGTKTGIRLSGEVNGLIPDSEWKVKRFNEAWQPGETLSVAIGQGYVDVTPVQLVRAYAAIGNGGFLYRPYLVRKIEGRGGGTLEEFRPELQTKIDLPQSVFDTVKEGLFRVINEPGGTAFLSKSKLTTLSGKTGTAQVRAFTDIMKMKCENMDRKDRHHGWFVGYAPRENPEIAIVAIAEHGCHGSSAAPIVRDVADEYFKRQLIAQGKLDPTAITPAKKTEVIGTATSAKPIVDDE